MKVKIIKDYNDLELKRLVTVKNDKELTVSDERGKVLIDAGVAEEIKATTKDEIAPLDNPEPKKTPKKKKEA